MFPTNPVLPGFFPDPSVCRAGDRYVLANSTFEYYPGLPVHVSDDLVHWQQVASAVTDAVALDFAEMGDSKGLYAPTVRYHDGTLYLVCTRVGGRGDGTEDTAFLVTATHAAGPWSPPRWVAGADGFDPALFFEGDRVYWCSTRIVRPGAYPGECEVWVREFDVHDAALVGEETVVWRGALHGATWAEGPRIFARNGWYYLLTAEGGTFRDHAIVIARSRSITGPYENCPRNPVLTHRHLGADYPVQNVGHADFVERPDGTWAAVLLAVRTEGRQHLLGRETFLAEVTWEDDWPVVNAGHGVLRDVGDRPLAYEQRPPSVEAALTVRGAPDFATEGRHGARLASTGDGVTDGAGRPAALLYRLQHRLVQVEAEVVLDDPGARVGLLLRQSSDHAVRVEVADGTARVLHRQGDRETVIDAWAVSGTSFVLSAELADGVRFAVDGRWSSPAPVDVLSSEVAGGFVGTTWGPYVEGAAGAAATVQALRYRSAGAERPERARVGVAVA